MHELETGWLDWMDGWRMGSSAYWFSVLGFTGNLYRLTRQTLIRNNVRVHDREKLSHTIHELENFSTRHIAHTKWKSINYDMTTAMTCPTPITFTYLIVGWTQANSRQSHANEHQKFFVSHTIYSHCLHCGLWPTVAENENAEKRVFVSSFEIIIIFHLGEFSFSPPNYMCFVRSKSCSPAKLEEKSFLRTWTHEIAVKCLHHLIKTGQKVYEYYCCCCCFHIVYFVFFPLLCCYSSSSCPSTTSFTIL